MRIFLTGGTGFIGSYVLSAALIDGHTVSALRRDSLSRPVIPLPSEPYWIDSGLDSVNPSVFKDVDVLIHLASTGVSPKSATINELIKTNIFSSICLFEQAVKAGVKRFVVAGTSHEYGLSSRLYDFIPPNAPLERLVHMEQQGCCFSSHANVCYGKWT